MSPVPGRWVDQGTAGPHRGPEAREVRSTCAPATSS